MSMGSFIVARRRELGMQAVDLARAAKMKAPYLSDIEREKISLPNADFRRRIAQALGVSHLDLLIAAGEITEAEIGSAGASGVVERDPEDPRQKIRDLIERVPDRDRLEGVADMLSRWVYGESASSPSAPSDTR